MYYPSSSVDRIVKYSENVYKKYLYTYPSLTTPYRIPLSINNLYKSYPHTVHIFFTPLKTNYK